MTRSVCACLVAILGLAVAGPRAQSRTGEVVIGDAATRVDQYLSRLVPFGYSGAVLIAQDGTIVLRKAYGAANRETGLAYDASMVSCIGSVTKQFTGAAIVKLQEQGKLKTSDPIAKYLPGVPADKAGITIHHLLTHTAGFSGDLGGMDEEPITRDALLAKVLAAPLASPPGAQFEYSNEGYSLAAMIVERVSGQSYETYLREQLFRPAGMNDTGYLAPAWPLERLPIGYGPQLGAWGRVYKNGWLPDGPGWYLRGNGGIHSSIDDLYRWHRALERPGVLSADSLKTYLTGQAPAPGGEMYAYGWGVQKTRRGGTLITHNGGNGYFFTDFRRYVDDRTVIIAMTNQAAIPATRLAPREIDALYFGGAPAPILPPAVVTVPAASAASLAGRYVLEGGVTLTVEADGARLTAAASDPLLLGGIPGLVAPGGRTAELEQRTMALVHAQARGDFTPFWEAFKDERPFELVQGNQRRFWAGWREQYGEFQRAELLGTAPVQGDPAVTVALKFARGTQIVQYAWGPRRLLGFLFGNVGGAVTLVAESPARWFTFSYQGNTLARLAFDGDRVTLTAGAVTMTGRRQ